jgi:hypothetical protein
MLCGLLVMIGLAVFFAPIEHTLGTNLRLVLLHGALVWAGKLIFGLAELAGLAGLLIFKHSKYLAGWSLALGRTGLAFWLISLPVSLMVMQRNWGGFFFAEPRWRIPFAFGVAAVLIQIGLAVLRVDWLTCIANLSFGAALWGVLGGAQNILHPGSPIFSGDAARIQIWFLIFLALFLAAGVVFTLLLRRRD